LCLAAPKTLQMQRNSAPRIFVADVIYSTDLEMPFDPYSLPKS
jgi:hypothetical protein